METFNGKVRHMTESVCELKPGRLRRQGGKVSLRMEKNFDPQGNLLEERYRSHKRINRITYQYDTKGRCIERREFSFDHVLFFRYKYKYDRWGHQIEAQCFNPDGTLSHSQSSRYNQRGEEVEKRIRKGESIESVKFVYNEQGHLCEEYASTNGKFAAHRSYRYDERGNKTADIWRNHEMDTTQSEWTYIYDDQGRIVEQLVLSDDQRVTAGYSFQYDDMGRRICTVHHTEEGFFSTNRISYDEQGHKVMERWRIRQQYDTEQQLCGEHRYAYDTLGHLVEESVSTGQLTCRQQRVDETDDGVEIVTHYYGSPDRLSYRIHYQYEKDQLRCAEAEHYNQQGSISQHGIKRYDPEGRLVEERQTEYTQDGILESCERYEYDAMGNWTLKECSTNGQVEEAITRSFEYWDDSLPSKMG